MPERHGTSRLAPAVHSEAARSADSPPLLATAMHRRCPTGAPTTSTASLSRHGGELREGSGSGEWEAITEHAGAPEAKQVRWGADLLKAALQRVHVAERLGGTLGGTGPSIGLRTLLWAAFVLAGSSTVRPGASRCSCAPTGVAVRRVAD